MSKDGQDTANVDCHVLYRFLCDDLQISKINADAILRFVSSVSYRFRMSIGWEPIWSFNDIDCIIPNVLFLGNQAAAMTPSILRQHNIGRVITVRQRPIPQEHHQYDIDYRYIQCHDEPTARLDYFIHRAVEWIVDARHKNIPVLVHCAAGMSRSPTIVVAYLMLIEQMSLVFAMTHVQYLRPIVSVNAGFYKQLVQLDSFPLWISRERRIYFLILDYLN